MTPKPISWTACPFCGAGPHHVCRPRGWPASEHDRRYYPMGTYHAARIKAARP